MGGLVAQAIATSFPDKVRGLVLAATFATTNVQSRLFLKAADCYKNLITAKQMFDLILPWLFSKNFLSSEQAVPFLSFPDDAPESQTPNDWVRSLNAQLNFDGRANLAKIKSRTLIICGSDDILAPPVSVPFVLSLSKPFGRFRTNGSCITVPDQ
jgi:pimeloyl-ACP methyl ester carboxylesterase